MSSPHESTNDSNDELLDQIDLLVEDELNSNSREELMGQLDKSENGWKLCAVSFLESQSIRRTIRETTNATVKLQGSGVSEPRQISRSGLLLAPKFRVMPFIAKAATLAALLGVAFFLGTKQGTRTNSAIANNSIDNGSFESTSRSNTVEKQEIQDKNPPVKDGIHLVGHVTMDDSIGNTIRLPILSGPGDRGNWVKESKLNILGAHRKKLSEAGWKIEKNRKLVSLNFRGEELTIPIEQLSYEYVGKPIF